MYAGVAHLYNSPLYHHYIRVITQLSLNIIISLLVDNVGMSSLRYWIRIARRKVQTPPTNFHQGVLITERQSH